MRAREVGSRPILSLTAFRRRCLHPRYRSVVWTLTWTEHATEGGHQPGNYAIVARDGCGRDTRLERDIAVKGYRKRSRAIPSACSGTTRDGTAKPATTPPLSRCCSMRSRNAVAYMRSNVILNFSVLATAPPVSTIDLPSAATV